MNPDYFQFNLFSGFSVECNCELFSENPSIYRIRLGAYLKYLKEDAPWEAEMPKRNAT